MHKGARSRRIPTGSRSGPVNTAPVTAATARGAAARSIPAPSSTRCRRRSCRPWPAPTRGAKPMPTRTRLDPTKLLLGPDMMYTDVWADTSQAGVTAHTTIALMYTGNANPANNLATTVPTNGIINYPDHIQPLWTRDRGANTCTNCHTDPDLLDLSATIAGDGRVESYDRVMIGD